MMPKSIAVSVRSLRVFSTSFAAVALSLLAAAHYGHRSTHALAAGHGQSVVLPRGSGGGTSGLTSFDVSGAGTVGLQGTAAVGVDTAGDVAGTYIDSNKIRHGFVRSANGAIAKFDAPGAGTTTQTTQGTVVVSMDSAGDVAGYYVDANVRHHGFLRSAGGTITTIDAPAANQTAYDGGTTVTAANTAGVSTGFYLDASYLVHSFVRSASGSFTPFDAPDANQNYTGTQTYSINAGGDVTGSYLDKTTNIRHGFVHLANGTLTEFNAPGATGTNNAFGVVNGTLPLSINTGGDITGVYTDASKLAHGFVRLANGTFTSFDAPNAGKTANVFTGLAVGLPGTGGASINDSGTVTGVYMDASSVAHGFIRSVGGTISVIDAANAGTGAGGFMGTAGVNINASGAVAGTYFDTAMSMHGYVLGGPTTVTVTPASSTATTTQSLSVTIAVSGGGTAPTGSVVLASGTYTSPATALSGGSATINIPAGSLAPGQDTLTATYTPDSASSSIYVGSSSTATVTVTSSTTTAIALTANPTSSVFGQQVVLTVVLNPYSAGSNTTNGEMVTFYSGTTSLGTGTLSSGVASLNVTSLAVGTDSLTAVYAGDTNFAGCTSNAVSFVVLGVPPTINFPVPNHAFGDAPFVVSATSDSPGALSYSVVSGPATIAGSTVTLTGIGTVVLQVNQAASGNYAAAIHDVTFTVSGQNQTITFTAPASPVNYGVAPIALSASASSGLTVRFSVLSGPATVSGSTLTITGAGTVVVAADQAGNTATYGPAPEVTRSITVNKIAPTAVGLSASVSSLLVQNVVTLTATVSSTVSTPSGSVIFSDGTTLLGTATLSGGVATLSVGSLAVGTHSITAAYGGDGNFTGASSSAVSETVQDFTVTAPTTTSQTISAGATATFTFPITVSGGTTLPAAVTFSATGAPAGSTVTFTPASLAAGSTPTSVVMTVATPAHALLERPGAGLPVVALALLLLPFVGRKRLGKIAVVMVMLTGLGGAMMLTGCGGNSTTGSGGGGTQPATSTITVTATSGALTHTSIVTLTVQ